MVHFGMTTRCQSEEAHSVNEAVNFIPLQWLTTGLPRFVSWLRWLRDIWLPVQCGSALKGRSMAALRAAVRHTRTNELIALHCAPHWCYTFLTRLRALLVSTPAHNSPHIATRLAIDRLLGDDRARAAVVADVDEALLLMRQRRVKAFLLKYSILPNETKPRQAYL